MNHPTHPNRFLVADLMIRISYGKTIADFWIGWVEDVNGATFGHCVAESRWEVKI